MSNHTNIRPIGFKWLVVAAALLLISTFTAAPAHAGGTVTNCADDSQFASLLAGGGLVTFNCGIATINFSDVRTISAGIEINGGGKITLSGQGARRLFVVSSGGSLTLKNIVLTSGYATDGHGTYSDGGAIINNGTLTLANVTVENTTSSNFNGTIATTGAVDITNSAFINNKAGNGGAIYANGSGAQVTINGSDFHDNSVISGISGNSRGGAIFIDGGANVNIHDSTFHNNSALNGGAITNLQGTLTLVNVNFSDNTLNNGNGGALANYGTADLTGVTFIHNSTRTGYGGAIYNKGVATVNAGYIFQNSSSYGGGIANDRGTITLTDSTLSSNSANVAGGGGIANEIGTMTLTRVTVSGNAATGDAGGVENGGYANDIGTATLTDVTISGNFADSGGGMSNLPGGEATLTNVTFFGNHAWNLAGGLGNSADDNFNRPAHLYLTNVIIAKSTLGDNCVFQKKPDLSQSNLSTDGTCDFGAGRNSVDIKLGPLETNGGGTLTHRLLPGSMAIDKGAGGCPSTDQRGVARFGPCDVGAVEFIPCAALPTKPELLAPVVGSKLSETQVLLDWVGPDCAQKFSVVVRQGSKKGNIVFSKGKLKPSQMALPALPKNQKYFWQVTACVKKQCTTGDLWKFKLK